VRRRRFVSVFDRFDPFSGQSCAAKISSGQSLTVAQNRQTRLKTVETVKTGSPCGSAI
jgi:hypothetical protein